MKRWDPAIAYLGSGEYAPDMEECASGEYVRHADHTEALLAALRREKAAPAPAAAPTRPEPRYKVGDWAADNETGARGIISRAEWSATQAQWRYDMGSVDYPESHLEPASPPAHEVVDVPPEPWHARLVRLAQVAQDTSKACAETEAAFKVADAERERTRLVRAAAREACHAARKALTEATTARAILDAQQPARDRMPPGEPKLLDAEPARPEPRYKVGDWVRVQHHGTVYQIGEVADPFGLGTLYFREKPGPGCTGQSWAAVALTPALDPALRETARTAARMLHKGEWPLEVERARELPGFTAWDTGELRTPDWAAQLEHLLGDAP